LGLVQVEPGDEVAAHHLEIEGVKVTWDDRIVQFSRMYGKIFIDFVQMFFEERFYVGFSGRSC
jgi:hypothetical protein